MVEVTFINDYKYSTSSPVYQWDYGQKLIMYGLDTTSEVIQVHFTDNSCERTIVRLASKYADYYQVSIPDGLLENSFPINAYIYLITEDSGETTHQISIPVIARKKPEGFTSQDDPIIQTQVEQLILDINAANDVLVDTANNLEGYVDNYVKGEIERVTNYAQGNSEAIRDLEITLEEINKTVNSLNNQINPIDSATIETGLYLIRNYTKDYAVRCDIIDIFDLDLNTTSVNSSVTYAANESKFYGDLDNYTDIQIKMIMKY